MKNFLKEWGLFILTLTLFFLSYLFIWVNVAVDGHSMDPTLADGERLFVVKTAQIDRFDIVVAKEVSDGEEKKIVKRVIGMPGDTITYDNDVLYINGKEVDEPYLQNYQDLFAKDKLQGTYAYNQFFQQLAAQADAFTINSAKETKFTVTVPENQYYLLGDDRLVSRDSRDVGPFTRDSIIGEVKFRFWPLQRFGTVD